MNNILRLVAILIQFSGCAIIDGTSGATTIEEIQKSDYQAQHDSSKGVDAVSRCMLQSLDGYQTEDGYRRYARAQLWQIDGATHRIALRVSDRPANGLSRALGAHIVFIENASSETTGTRSRLWVHRYGPPSGLQESLNTLINIVRVCW